MGQYYYPIILDAEGKIVIWMCANAYSNGAKLTEHSFIGNEFVSTFEFGLSPEGIYHKSRVVWAGDYAKPDTDESENLYHKCNEYSEVRPRKKETTKYRFVVNHSKRLFVDKTKVPKDRGGFALHPLPLLTAEGNVCGGGDYRGLSEHLVGTWARDVISVEEAAPADFEELIVDFVERCF
jgi:hypothetical protein